MMNMSVPQHVVLHDETGRSIVIEPSVENNFKFYDNPLGVFTNAPTFDFHLNNLKTWLERATGRHYSFDNNEKINQIKFNETNSGSLEFLLTINQNLDSYEQHFLNYYLLM